MRNWPQVLAAHQSLRDWLRAEFPDIDDEALRDTLEGISELPALVAAIIGSYLDDVALATALRSRASDMQGRLARLEDRVEKKRALVASVMERADIKKLTEPEFTVSLRPTPAPLIIIDEADIPDTFWKPQPPKLDRKGLLAALNTGKTVAGATLGNGGVTIAVRTS
jgi:hypothetical protein